MDRKGYFLMNTNIRDFTVGVEEEYMICNPINGDLVDKASFIMDSFNHSKRFSYELIESEIEANTSVHYEINQAIKELAHLRTKINNLGKNNNFTLGVSGTHPTAKPENQTFVNNESYNWVKNQLNYYAQRNMTFSTHFHISVPDFNKVTDIMNAMRRWIAPLLALSANSPFFSGFETGMKSSRTMQFGAFPRTNIPKSFNSLNEYIDYTNKLIEIKSIEKSRHIWWKIRPHLDYKTLEFRICDAQRSLVNIHMLASMCRALVHAAYVDFDNTKLSNSLSVEYLNDSLWKASRFGFDCVVYDELSGKNITIKNLIEEMYNYSSKSLNLFGDQDSINAINFIINNGTEGDEQINIYKQGGFDKLKLHLINNVDYSTKE